MYSVGILLRWSLPDICRASIWQLLQMSRCSSSHWPLLHRAANPAAGIEITVYRHDQPAAHRIHLAKGQVSTLELPETIKVSRLRQVVTL